MQDSELFDWLEAKMKERQVSVVSGLQRPWVEKIGAPPAEPRPYVTVHLNGIGYMPSRPTLREALLTAIEQEGLGFPCVQTPSLDTRLPPSCS